MNLSGSVDIFKAMGISGNTDTSEALTISKHLASLGTWLILRPEAFLKSQISLRVWTLWVTRLSLKTVIPKGSKKKIGYKGHSYPCPKQGYSALSVDFNW